MGAVVVILCTGLCNSRSPVFVHVLLYQEKKWTQEETCEGSFSGRKSLRDQSGNQIIKGCRNGRTALITYNTGNDIKR